MFEAGDILKVTEEPWPHGSHHLLSIGDRVVVNSMSKNSRYVNVAHENTRQVVPNCAVSRFALVSRAVQDTATKDTNPKAAKYDGGKAKAGTLYEYFPNALMAVSEVSTFGCIKYSRGSFHEVPNGLERYTDAMHRHFLQEQQGEERCTESELRHAAHAAWGALCRLEFIIRGEQDD